MRKSGLLNTFRRTSLLLALVIAFGGPLLLKADDADKARLQLIVEGVERAKGHIIVGLFACEPSYLEGDHPLFHVLLPAEPRNGRVAYTFEALPSGTYAIKLFHDINDNQKLDSNWLGIPREPFGFSNNPRVRFGPPDFDATRFDLPSGKLVRQTVVLN
jgi:uncharacterized protein (DUF2141 family)